VSSRSPVPDSPQKATLADNADRYVLYQRSVQAPPGDIEFFDETFRAARDREPLSLREDFCGTALLCAEWVRSDPRRTAVGVDLSAEALEWGRIHNLSAADPGAGDRVTLICSEVRDVRDRRHDIVCAMNFSICALKERSDLDAYLEVARQSLVSDGMFVCELYGGTEAIVATGEERDCDGYTYHWEQERFNPLTHETHCHIHFSFPDGSRIDRAFSYQWRLWTVPEVRESLLSAGFSRVRVFWEQTDEEGAATGEYVETVEEENQDTWLVYIVALG
jgi:hypothetical protein